MESSEVNSKTERAIMFPVTPRSQFRFILGHIQGVVIRGSAESEKVPGSGFTKSRTKHSI